MRNISASDQRVLKKIASLKAGFVCTKKKPPLCGCTEYYKKKDFSRKCKQCGHVESVTANTAFAGIRKLSITAFLDVLQDMQTHYFNYRKYEKEIEEMGRMRRSVHSVPSRMKLEKIAKKLDMETESVWRLLKRVTDFFPDFFGDLSSGDFHYWLQGTMSTTQVMYEKLFTLLFKDSGNIRRKRNELLKLLVVKITHDENGYYDY